MHVTKSVFSKLLGRIFRGCEAHLGRLASHRVATSPRVESSNP